MPQSRNPRLVRLIQAVLLLEAIVAVFEGRFPSVFVALGTWTLTLMPRRFARWIGVELPPSFLVAIVFFIFATLFLGEVFDFYNRYFWWDMMLHFSSAMGFGLLAFLFIFTLFEGDRFAAPPWAVALLAFCVALAIGVIWEIFEFGMDQMFGFNMQKSGLVDTMYDMIINTLGAALGAFVGFLYLRGRQLGGLGKGIADFIALNRRLYGKMRNRNKP